MSEVTNHLFDTIDEQNGRESAHTRRTLVKGTAAALGSMGLVGFMTGQADAAVKTDAANSVANIVAVAATAEVLATIVNTVGPEKLGNKLDSVTKRNIQAAAQQEKNHYELLTSSAVGGKAVTKTIYVPDEVFASPGAAHHAGRRRSGVHQRLPHREHGVRAPGHAEGLAVRPLHRGDHGRRGRPPRARPAVARATARQRPHVHAVRVEREQAPNLPTTGTPGFYKIMDAVGVLESAGFGFGKPGSKPGTAYDYDTVSARTPTDPQVNTIKIS